MKNKFVTPISHHCTLGKRETLVKVGLYFVPACPKLPMWYQTCEGKVRMIMMCGQIWTVSLINGIHCQGREYGTRLVTVAMVYSAVNHG